MTDRDLVRSVQPKTDAEGRVRLVVLDRVEPGVEPPYCVHGRVTCYACDEWVWLGDATHDVVASGEAAGICRECAARTIPSGTPVAGRIEDTRRGDPH